MEAIAIDALSKTYCPRNHAPVLALHALSLSIPAGQVLGLLGSTGAGKTTAIKLIAGLVKPTAGHVRLLGYDLTREPEMARAQIGVHLASRRILAGHHTVWETLLFAAGIPGKQASLIEYDFVARAEHLLLALDLWTRRDEPVHMLSAGMQQRLSLARALMSDAPILLLDEPTHGLSVPEAGEVIAAVRAVHTPGRTIVLATSHLALACDLCDRVAILQGGRLVTEQAIPDLLDLLRQERYQIVLKGYLDRRWTDWFDGLTMTHTRQGETVLSGVIADQSALHGLLIKVRNLNLPLLAVNRIEPDLDETLQQLLGV